MTERSLAKITRRETSGVGFFFCQKGVSGVGWKVGQVGYPAKMTRRGTSGVRWKVGWVGY